jgi:hypothetical protein
MVPCPLCSLPLMLPTRGAEETIYCPGCRREVTMVVWPALDRGPMRAPLPQAVVEGGAACFSCPDKAATGVCDGCGCYTCPACEADWFGESLCLTCLHARREVMKAPRFRHRVLLHDNIALMLLALPIFIIPVYGFFFAVLASPVALLLVIRHRKAPRGLPPRGPFRLFLAGGLALLLMLLVVAGIGAVIWSVMEINQRPATRAADEAAASAAEPSAGGASSDTSTGEEDQEP